MIYRKLGNSGLQISLLSFGSWVTFSNQVDEKLATSLMVYAYEKGVNFFDNAEVYAHGQSEIIMGKVLKKMSWDRSSYLVSSKAFFGRGDKRPNMTGLSRKHLKEACSEALGRLQLDYLDLFYAHRPDPLTPMEEVVWTMHQLIMQGKILYWGTSEWSADEILSAHAVAKQNQLIGPITEQSQYNFFNRDKVEVEFQTIYKTVGLGNTIWSPLASGMLTNKYLHHTIPNESRLALSDYAWLKEKLFLPEKIQIANSLNDLAKQLNTSLAKLAIAWCAQNPMVSSVILGATKLDQLKENLESLELLPLLTTEVNLQIDKILKI